MPPVGEVIEGYRTDKPKRVVEPMDFIRKKDCTGHDKPVGPGTRQRSTGYAGRKSKKPFASTPSPPKNGMAGRLSGPFEAIRTWISVPVAATAICVIVSG